jgi:Tol biopolymer transport system component
MKRFVLIACVASCAVGLAAVPPAGATFPGANGKIAFAWNGRRTLGIGSIDPDGANRAGFDTVGRNPRMPAWSADGTKIAYIAGSGLRTMDADGSANTLVVPDTTSHTFLERPNWSPDGTQLVFDAYVSPENGFRLFVVNDDGTGLTRIDSPGPDEYYPEWSPDGSSIAYFSSSRRGTFIRTMNPDGTGRVTVTDGFGYGGPSWAPDGSMLTFVAGRGNDVFVVNTDGTGRTRLTSTKRRNEFTPVFSPDGTQIAFARGSGGGFVPTDIWIMNADGTSPAAITHTARRNEFPWSWQAT